MHPSPTDGGGVTISFKCGGAPFGDILVAKIFADFCPNCTKMARTTYLGYSLKIKIRLKKKKEKKEVPRPSLSPSTINKKGLPLLPSRHLPPPPPPQSANGAPPLLKEMVNPPPTSVGEGAYYKLNPN